MSTINVVESHQKSADEIKSGLIQFEEMFKKYGVKISWEGSSAKLSGPVSGAISITNDHLEVTIKLGMMAKMAGIEPKRLENSIRKRLRLALD